jgi:multicomponent Na+:H+ antiporter subunit A
MLTAVLLAFGVAVLAPLLARAVGPRAGWLLALLPAGLTAYFISFVPRIAAGETVLERIVWVSALDVHLSMRLDGLSLVFALMICGIGTAIVVYAGGYLHGDRQLPRFYLLLLSFMAAMLGVVLADNLIVLFVFWELTSLTSYFLVGYKHEDETSRKSALQALLVTGGGGLAMLAGFLLLGVVGGSFELSTLLADPEAIQAHPAYLAILLLIGLGALTKSAQWPFHFWLPNAMAAPTPVSAFLHSATMVKAGVYLLARMSPGLGGTDVWFALLVSAGVATMVAAAALALLQRDSKRLLAYSTLIALGTLVALIGVGTPGAVAAMVVFLVGHALYKAPLFMVAGSVDHEAGSRDVTAVRGLGRRMPITWATALIAGLSAGGLPPLFGFVAKELAFEGLFDVPWVLAALIAASAVMVVVVYLVAWRPFSGREVAAPKEPHEAPLSMWLGPGLLASAGAVLGFAPWLVGDRLMVPAAAAILGELHPFRLYLWHGFNLALGLSALTVTLGIVLVWRWRSLHQGLVRATAAWRFGPVAAYEGVLDGLVRFAAWQTRVLQSDDLRHHMTIILGFLVTLLGITALRSGALDLRWSHDAGYFYEYVILALVVIGGLSVLRAHSRLVAITSLGIVGFGIAILFIFFAAPDLAITQFLVETLIVIIVALVLIRLPHGSLRESPSWAVRTLSGSIAIAGGLLITMLTLAITAGPFDARLTAYFEAESYLGAEGRNIVNVILVDFRAIDTLGEITVLAVAATGAFALLRRRLSLEPASERDERETSAPAGGRGGAA